MPISVADFYAETRSNAFGPEVIRRILLVSYALTAEYVSQNVMAQSETAQTISSAFDNYFLQAQRVRNLVRSDYDHIFRDHSVLAGLLLRAPALEPRSSHSPKRKPSALHDGIDVL